MRPLKFRVLIWCCIASLFLVGVAGLAACASAPSPQLDPTDTSEPVRLPPSPSPEESPQPVPPTATATSVPDLGLRNLAEPAGIYIGAATGLGPVLNDPEYARLLSREFNMLTPEVAMKWEDIRPEPERYDFTGADALVEFAQEHGMAVRGHTLVWDYGLPQWLVEGDYTPDEVRALLREHIYTVVGRYRGQIYAWDVINEPLNESGGLRDTFWLRAIGPEYLSLALHWAHEADPDALLFINEFGAEGKTAKAEGLFALAEGLLAVGAPLYGIGLQMHVGVTWAPPAADLAANLDRLNELGLEAHITEMDVRLQDSGLEGQEALARQADVYRETLGVCLQAPNCRAFVTWGVTDRYSWIPYFTGQPDAPLLFDEDGRPKPAYDALFETLNR